MYFIVHLSMQSWAEVSKKAIEKLEDNRVLKRTVEVLIYFINIYHKVL